MNQVSQTPPEPFRQPPTIIIQPRRSNGLGTAGFILALIAMLGCWIPVLSWILWTLGFLFSFIGIFKSPRGLAIAGLIISIAGLAMILITVGALAGLLAIASTAA